MMRYSFCRLVLCFFCIFFFKQKTAYEMRISDWSSDVCSSDLPCPSRHGRGVDRAQEAENPDAECECATCGYTARTARKWLEQAGAPLCPIEEIGRASCRERVWQYV